MSALLEVRGPAKRFGALRALDGIDLEAAQGSLTGLIGPNGAGKSTAFGCLSGRVVASGGARELGESDLIKRAFLGL